MWMFGTKTIHRTADSKRESTSSSVNCFLGFKAAWSHKFKKIVSGAKEEFMFNYLNRFQMTKENLNESGFEPETSGLTYQRSY